LFLSHRVTHPRLLDASIETHAAVHTRYRVHVVRNRRLVAEDGLFLRTFDRKGYVGRPILTVLLAGAARIRAYGTERWLGPGDVSIVESKGVIEMRQEGAEYRSLVVEWEPGFFGDEPPKGFQTGRVSELERAHLDALALELTQPELDATGGARAIASALRRLRAAGLPFAAPEAEDLIEPVPEPALRLSATLDVLLSDLSANPMAVDLDRALGVSSRHLTRLVAEFHRRYGYNAESWRDALCRRRITVGAALMSVPEATTDIVSRLLGYSSPTAFCRAVAEAQLPSPGRIGAAIEALR